jgi:small subunit ribosomal protein S1
MAEDQKTQTSTDTADDTPTTLEQVDPQKPADEPAEEEGIAKKALHTIEDAAEKAQHAAADAAGVVGEAASKAAHTVSDVASKVAHTVGDAASAATEGIQRVAGRGDGGEEIIQERIEGSSETVDPDAPVAVESADDLETVGSTFGYDGRIQGKVISLAELHEYENRRDPDEPEDRDEDFLAMVEQSMTDVLEGEIVTGRVVAVGPKEVLIDFGFKSTGAVAKNEFDHVLEVGDEVEVFLERKEDRLGQPVISKEKAETVRRWQTIEEAFENEGVLEGTIVRRIKGGMIVDLMGAEAFLPGSQVDVRPVRDFDAYLDKTMEFKVVKINATNGNVVISHKALVEKDLAVQREQILDTMEVGQILEGQVKNIVDFGVFIDLGGVDGLLHITDLSWGRVGHPSEVVELDQKLNVVVLNYEKERQRISLGLKQLLSHPWENIQEKYAEGQTVQGRVVSITDYGAFVELEKGIEGLVHISEMSYTEHVKHPTQKVQLGQIVDVKVLNIDTEEKKISLGMKQLEADPWGGLVERYSAGQVTTGTVRNITSFGAFVELEPGIDGLVHVSDLSWTKRVKHPSEVVKKGQELEVMVLDVDVAQRRLSLGHKQVQTDPWQQFATAYEEDTDTTAQIVEITPDGLRVELPLDAPGFVPASHLERGNTAAYAEGEELALRVIRLDKQERDIILSEVARRRASERAERDIERSEKTAQRRDEQRAIREFERESRGPATLGELTGLEALKAKMEAQEAETEAPDASAEQETAPEVKAPSEADSKAVQAEQPEEEAPPQTRGKASAELEATEGVGNRGTAGKDPDEFGDTGRLEHPTEPPADQSQRKDEGGDYPPAEQSKASHKGAEIPEEGAAASAEAATDDQTPATDAATEPHSTGKATKPSEVKIEKELKKPASEAAADAEKEEKKTKRAKK